MPQTKLIRLRKRVYKNFPLLLAVLLLVFLFSSSVVAAPLSRFLSSEFGPDGFQISEMGPPIIFPPPIASSSTNGFLLAVWEGTAPTYTGVQRLGDFRPVVLRTCGNIPAGRV